MQIQVFFMKCVKRLSGVFIPAIFLCLFATVAHAEGNKRPKIGLVLSGGGAKGVAHIGALKVLEEAGIPIDYISGTSMGAIVGGLYAIGYDAAQMDSMVRSQDWIFLLSGQVKRPYQSYSAKMRHDRYLFSIPFSDHAEKPVKLPPGVMRGQSVLNKFSDLTIGYHSLTSFDSLPIPFACVAGDLVKGQEVVINRGSLPLAMRASMAVPGVFSPVYCDSMVLIDGGIFNNFPVDVVKEMGADITIGMDLSTKGLTEPDYQTMTGIADRIAFLVGEEKKERNMKAVDLYMNPRLKGYTSADFNAADIDTMMAMGEREARAHWDDLMRLKKHLERYELPARKKISIPEQNDSLAFIQEIRIEGLCTYDKTWIEKMGGIRKGERYTLAMLEDCLNTLQGTGLFSEVTYRITDDNHGKVLCLTVTEKSAGSFNIGMRIDTEEIASVLLHTQYRMGGMNGSGVFATTRINRSPWLNVGYTYNTRRMKSLEVSYRIGYNDYKLYQSGDKTDDITYLYNHAELSFRDYFLKRFNYRIGLQYDYFSNVSLLYTPQYKPYEEDTEGYGACYFMLGYDTFDKLVHPIRGVSCNLTATAYANRLFSDESSTFGSVSVNLKAALPLGSSFCLLPEMAGRVLIGENIPGFYLNHVGGECAGRYRPQQMAFYGIHYTELAGNSTLLFRTELRYNMVKKHYISCIGNYMTSGNRLKRIWDGNNVWGVALKYSYDSLIGPLSFMLDYSNRTSQIGVYANVGYYF